MPVIIFALLIGTAWTGRASVAKVDVDPELHAGEIALMQVAAGTAWTVAADLTTAGASEVAAFDSVNLVSARLTGAAHETVAAHPSIHRAIADTLVVATDRDDDEDDEEKKSSNRGSKKDSIGGTAIRAPQAWSRSTGAGVVVAIMDSGIAAHPDLPASKVVARKNFVADGATSFDPAGHGTHLAGVIAAQGATFKGIAPDARLVDLRVLDAHGNGTLSDVVSAFDWLLKNRKALGINILNLSIGTRQRSSYHADLLSTLAEAVWFAGITVVAAAGNDGPAAGTIATPGSDPFVITAGSFDDQGTLSSDDDRESEFSSRGPTKDLLAKPDVLAPGRRVVSLRAADATFDATYALRAAALPDPLKVVRKDSGDDEDDDDDEDDEDDDKKRTSGDTASNKGKDDLYIRMSGTSVSSAMVAGVAALVLSLNKSYTPTRVKSAIVGSGRDVSGTSRNAVDAARALTAQARGTNAGLLPSKLLMATLVKSGVAESGTTWEGITWEGVTWESVTWESVSWEAVTWEGVVWERLNGTGVMWENVSWERLGDKDARR